MTDHLPEVVATADLTPESPKPINLSSSPAVPALQDQADSLSTMALSPTLDMKGPGVTSDVQVPIVAGDDQLVDPAIKSQSETSPDVPQSTSDVDNYVVAPNDSNTRTENSEIQGQQAEVVGPDESVKPNINSENSLEAQDSSETDDIPKNELSAESTSGQVKSPSVASPVQEFAAAMPLSQEQLVTDVSQSEEAPQAAEGQTQDPSQTDLPLDDSAAEEGIDIQALVDKITATAAPPEPTPTAPPAADASAIATANPQSSLPPKPPASQQPSTADLRAEELRRFQPATVSSLPNVPQGPPAYPYPAPGTMTDIPGYASFPTGSAGVAASNQYSPSQAPGANGQNLGQPQRWDDFQKEERKYVSEAKWDRFPDGSRLFIGNLSSERVSKREVFDIFAPFGRLAQISLKQAFGFVQYHDVTEGQAAMDNLQGIEIRGRKIHLEFSRTQKKDGDGERRGNRDRDRGGRAGGGDRDRGSDRFDGRRRDGYRPRSPSPSRGGHHRQDSYGRERDHWQPPSDYSRRGRSRSPIAHGSGGYRRRSPSPYHRGPPTSEADLDIPRRYGADVPDVQLLLLQEVHRDFITWVQSAFIERGLKVDVMHVSPRFPRDVVIQRQVVEGVLGVSELDFRAQGIAKISLQTFDRSAGRHNARFDQYQDLDPKIAAEVVFRTKSQAQQLSSPPAYGHNQYPPASYGAAAQPLLSQPYPHQTIPQPQHAPSYSGQHPANLQLAGLDNATLQKVLSAFQGGPSGAPAQHLGAPGVDVNAVLSALSANGTAATPNHQQPHGYPQAPAHGVHGGHPANSADQAHVQNIMAQLSRYRQ